MHVRVEVRPDSFHRLDIQRTQDVFHLLDDQLDASAKLLGASAGLERQLKVVDHGQKLLDRTGARKFAKLSALARLALAGVVKLRLHPRHTVEELVALRLDPFIVLERNPRWRHARPR